VKMCVAYPLIVIYNQYIISGLKVSSLSGSSAGALAGVCLLLDLPIGKAYCHFKNYFNTKRIHF